MPDVVAPPALEGAVVIATETKRRDELRSEVLSTQHALVALLQERLETAKDLKAARAELEQVTRAIEQVRSEHTHEVLEFERLVLGAKAEGSMLAAEIEELARRRDGLIERKPTVARSDTAAVSGGEPTGLSVTLQSARERVTPRLEQRTAHRLAAAPGRVRLHRPSLRQLAKVIVGCMLVLLAILLTPVSQVVGGLQLLAVMSGSMEPTIQVGGIVGVVPVAATDLQVGNVITFATQANPDVLVTHRIVSLETRDGQTMVTTKGDANNSVDAMAAPADHAVGRVDFSLPWLGYLMVWLASPVAKILILVFTVISFALPSVKRASRPAAEGPKSDVGESPATSYTALEDEIQALLSAQP